MHQHWTFGCVARRLEGLGDPPEEGTVALEASSCCPDGVWESTTRPWEPGPRVQRKGGNWWTAGCTSQVSAPEGLSLTSGLDTLPPPLAPLGRVWYLYRPRGAGEDSVPLPVGSVKGTA